MAIRDAKGLIRGRIGEVVFKVVNGKQVMYQVPEDVKQSMLSKKSAKMFGVCSKQTSILMGRLRPWLGGKVDNRQAARLRGACLGILKDNDRRGVVSADLGTANMSDLKGFEFNIDAPFEKYFRGVIQITGEPTNGIQVVIPSFEPSLEINFIKGCEAVDFHLLAIHYDFNDPGIIDAFHRVWSVSQNVEVDQERRFSIDPLTRPGITIIVVQLLFFRNTSKFGKEYLNDKNCFPAQIVYVR